MRCRQDIYKRYLEALDAGKLFFTAQDMAKFAPYTDAARRRDQERRPGAGRTRSSPSTSSASTSASRYARSAAQAGHLRLQRQRALRLRPRGRAVGRRQRRARRDLEAVGAQRLAAPEARRQEAGRDPQDARQALRQPGQGASHELNGEDVFQTFLNAYANSIDPHTDYFNPRTRRELQPCTMSLSLEGIGAVLQKQDDVRRDPRDRARRPGRAQRQAQGRRPHRRGRPGRQRAR